MTDKKKQIRDLYEEAVYYHLIHSGRKIRRDQFKLNWND